MAFRSDRRTIEERNHLMCYLKFKIPFFENFEKDMIFMIVEQLEPRLFKEKDKSNLQVIEIFAI